MQAVNTGQEKSIESVTVFNDGTEPKVVLKDAKESKQTKKSASFLGEKERADMVKQLDDWGIDAKELSDMEIINRLRDYATDMTNKVVNKQTKDLTKELMFYAEGSNLKDIKFIDRLYHLNVPDYYLRILTDADTNLDDKQIWTKIRKSGINPYTEDAERLKPRYELPKKKLKRTVWEDA